MAMTSSKISKNVKNHPLGVGVGDSKPWQLPGANLDVSLILQTLPDVPFCLHNMHFPLSIDRRYYYSQTQTPVDDIINRGKLHKEVIWGTTVQYMMYPNGTVDIITKDSDSPHRIESEQDIERVLIYTEEIRSRMKCWLGISDDSSIPKCKTWRLAYCEVNRDVSLPPSFVRWGGLTITLGDFIDTVKVYIKDMGGNAVVFRAETTWSPGISLLDALGEAIAPSFSLKRRAELSIAITARLLQEYRKIQTATVKRKRTRGEHDGTVQEQCTSGLSPRDYSNILGLSVLLPKDKPLLRCSDCGQVIHVGRISPGIQEAIVTILSYHIAEHKRFQFTTSEVIQLREAGFQQFGRDSL
jgi:hypothetical protein